MFTHLAGKKNDYASRFVTDAADAQMVSQMRLLLAVSALLAVLVDPSGLSGLAGPIWLVFFAYLTHSMLAYVYSRQHQGSSQTRLIHWLDVLWYGLIVYLTGGINSFFFLFFFFAILTSSFRWGFEEGAKITLLSASLYAACAYSSTVEDDLPRLLLRTTFLLSLGYMCVFWGDSKVELKRRLALLRDVGLISNPRFGVDHTITSVLQKTCDFFGAGTCLLVMKDRADGACSLRTVNGGTINPELKAIRVDPEGALPLLAFLPEHIVYYSRRFWASAILSKRPALSFDPTTSRWDPSDDFSCKQLAELLNVHSFISAPLSLRKGHARIFVGTNRRALSRADALFLGHIGVQAFPVIENIELLDRMASEAALHERQKIARDLHDTAIQPYIGLKLALGAIRGKAASANPLIGDLDKLIVITTEVIADLRRYASTVTNESGGKEPLFMIILRHQAEQMREFYGIEFAISLEGELNVSDRLTAEVLQLVREGLSNICRHSKAERGWIRLYCAHGRLKLEIENESSSTEVSRDGFVPRSISERAASLGGTVIVNHGLGINTLVQVEIPV